VAGDDDQEADDQIKDEEDVDLELIAECNVVENRHAGKLSGLSADPAVYQR